MKVVVGPPNPFKVSAVVDAFSKYFDVDVSSVDVDSGVKAFPDCAREEARHVGRQGQRAWYKLRL